MSVDVDALPVRRIVISGLPPSDNNAYANRARGGRKLTPAAAGWKAYVTGAILVALEGEQRLFRGKPWGLVLMLCLPLKSRAGRWQRFDVSSHQKLTVDAVAEAIGVDDSLNMHLTLAKLDAPMKARQTIIEISVFPEP